jgi:hypothetical protein
MNSIRFLLDGIGPQQVHYMDGMKVGAVLAAHGIHNVPDGKTLSVDGHRANTDTPVRPGSTVAMQPKAFNG